EIWMDGERVSDVTKHPAFKPIVDLRARMFDMQHEKAYREALVYVDESGNANPIVNKLPRTKRDWFDKWRAVDIQLRSLGGVVTRVGDETIGELWSLYDGKSVLEEVDTRFSQNVEKHIYRVLENDIFHVSANTDPKGDRSLPPQEQDPDMLLHAVRETDAGIVVRGAKYETAASYADQAFVKPTIANWGDARLSEYAVGFICPMNAPRLRHICRSGFAGRQSSEDYPLANNFDEVDTLLIFDDVVVPWENVLFYQHTRAASYIRASLHRYSAFSYTLRFLYFADLMIGAAVLNVRQTGLDKNPAVREKLAQLAIYRETINAHLLSSIYEAESSPAGLLMPKQSLLYAGRVQALSRLAEMMHLTRELCGGQVCVTPDSRAFANGESANWLKKYYSINENWAAEDRRRLLAFTRDLLNSSYAGHRLTFALFAQSPPFAQLNAVYNTFDFDGAAEFAGFCAGLTRKDEVAGDARSEVSALTAVRR
ncbi:MAG: 4-hydroxyphenylacetate 3-hydroxylase family protein, partial [Vulcanimicrobiaceae bacterium]